MGREEGNRGRLIDMEKSDSVEYPMGLVGMVTYEGEFLLESSGPRRDSVSLFILESPALADSARP